MAERVTWTVSGEGVADVRLNRPEKLNALDAEMIAAIGAAADQVGADPRVRAVVLSGEGRAFCAGLDLAMFSSADHELAESVLSRPAGREDNAAQHTAWAWQSIAVPVIAAVHGVALGGGLQIALGADIRIVAPDARLSVMEIQYGIVPDMAGTWLLPRLVGPDVAKELAWTGRTVTGADAVSLGLATRASQQPREDALALAGELAARNPEAVRAVKALLGASLPAGTGGRGAGDQFADEERAQRSLIGSPNQLEAVAAAAEGRRPRFADPAPSVPSGRGLTSRDVRHSRAGSSRRRGGGAGKGGAGRSPPPPTLKAMNEAQDIHRSQHEQPPAGPEPAGVEPVPASGDQAGSATADLAAVEEFVTAWRRDLEEQGSVPASSVQDRLLDLWGTLPQGQMRVEVERWLTETLARNLYTVADIDHRLESVVQAAP